MNIHILIVYADKKKDLTRFNKNAIQGTPEMMAADKEAVGLSRVNAYYSKCNLPLH